MVRIIFNIYQEETMNEVSIVCLIGDTISHLTLSYTLADARNNTFLGLRSGNAIEAFMFAQFYKDSECYVVI